MLPAPPISELSIPAPPSDVPSRARRKTRTSEATAQSLLTTGLQASFGTAAMLTILTRTIDITVVALIFIGFS